jgi:hypothetical protein
LIGAPEGSDNIIMKTLEENCSTGNPLSPNLAILGLPERTESDIFLFDVERFIQF